MLSLIRKSLTVVLLVLTVLLSALSAAFASDAAEYLAGSWAFSYAPEETVLTLAPDGTAVYHHISCTWTCSEDSLQLTGSDGAQTALRWEPCESGILLYIPTGFDRVQGTEGLVGSWKAMGGSSSSFIFAANGHFLEDETFTGTYAVDEEHGTITLNYGGLFQDTVIYYSFADDFLTIAYPWKMVRPS